MAKLTEREVVILVKALGLDKAISGFGTLDKSIKQTQKTSGELDRNMKGTANITSNTTKAFAKQAQGLGGLVHVYATVAANVFALSSAFNVLKSNADLKIMEQASRQLSIASGTNFNLVAKSLKEVTGGAISMKEAMQTATLGLRGGATSTQLQQITDVATKAAKALGRSVPEAVTRLTQAVIKGEPELADEFGIILRVEEATKKYAATLGKTVKDLSTFERQQAIINQAIEQGTKKYGNLKIDVNPYDKMASTFSELTNKILQFVSIPIGSFLGALSENINLMVLAILAFAKAVAQRAIPELFKLGNAMIESTKKSAASAIASYKAQADAIDNLIKKQKALEVSRQLKSINARGVLGELDIKSKMPRLEKAISKGLNPGQLAKEFWATLYSQIAKESKKYGGDIAKVTVDSIKSPLQKEFLKLAQTYNALQKARKPGAAFDPKQIIGQLGGADITAQQYQQLQQIINVYNDELKKGVTHTQAFKNAQLALNATGLSTTQMMMSLRTSTHNVAMGYQTLRVAITTTMQAMAEGSIKNLSHAQSVEVVRAKLAEMGLTIEKSNSKLLSFGVGIGKVFGKITSGIALLGSFVGGIFNLVMVLTLAWEGLKVLGEWLGLTNSKMSESITKVNDLSDEFKTTRAAISQYQQDLQKAQSETYNVDTQLELLGRRAAIFDTLSLHAKEFVKVLQEMAKAGKEGLFARFWAGLTDEATEGVQAVRRQILEFESAIVEAGGKIEIEAKRMYGLITPEKLISGSGASSAMADLIKQAFDPANYDIAKIGENGAIEFSNGFRNTLRGLMQQNPLYKDMGFDGIEAEINRIQSKLPEITKSLQLQGFAEFRQELMSVTYMSQEYTNKVAVYAKTLGVSVEDVTRALKSSEAAYSSYLSAAKSGVTDLLKAQDSLIKGTSDGFEKYNQQVLETVNKIRLSLSEIKDVPDINPYKDLLAKAPELLGILNITEESFNTQAKAQETLSRLSQEALAGIKQQAQLASEIIIAEQALATAKRNVGLVESKNFEEKKRALDVQYDAEEKLLDLQIQQLEQLESALVAQQASINATYLEAIAANDLLFTLNQINAAKWEYNAAVAEGNRVKSQGELEGGLAKVRGELQAAKDAKAELSKQRSGALGKVDSAAAKAGESAADKAQAQAEKIANLEASIAKKRLDRAAMFLALEKELGDAVESRMEWELTGAREAVALGNKRIAILGRELSMQASLIPMKKAVMEAEAKALEIKAEGLEKDGEIKAAEEARLEVANKRQEMNNLDIEYITMRLEYEQKLYDIALKQHDLRKRAMVPTFKEGSGIQGSEEFFQTAKVEFALRWDKFLDEMTTPVDRLLDAFEGAVNSGVDAFVEAIANGEDALTAAKDAIKQTMFDLAKEWLKEDIKNLIYSTVGSALGMEDPKDALKEELLNMAQADKTQHVEITTRMDQDSATFNNMLGVLHQINAKTGGTQQGIPNLGNMFGMNQQQYSNVSMGLENLFDQRPDLFGADTGLGGQLDNLFASQPDIFGSAPGYSSVFGSSSSFGTGGLGSSFMNLFGTMPAMPTQSIGSSDIFSGSSPLAMPQGSMLNFMGMGSLLGPSNSLTQGVSSIGQGLSGMAAPQMQMGTGMGMSSMTQTPQMQMGGIGGLSGGLGMSSMFMSMIPMLMGGLMGGGSPAGQAAKEKSGSSSTDAALGSSGGSEDAIEDVKDETKELKDLSEKLLTEIKDNVIEIKVNDIAFQIEHMEKMDKQFQTWLAIYMVSHMQDIMLLTMMVGQLQLIGLHAGMHTQFLSQIAGCACGMGGMGGMAKGGIVSGLLRGYAKGAITTGPELAMIGEGKNREAIVPLPDNRSIPVTITNKQDDNKESSRENRPINIVINGVEGTEKGLKRSAMQIAYQVDRTRRNILTRY